MRLRITRPRAVFDILFTRFLPYLRLLPRPERGPEYMVTKVFGMVVPLGMCVFNVTVRVWQTDRLQGEVSHSHMDIYFGPKI